MRPLWHLARCPLVLRALAVASALLCSLSIVAVAGKKDPSLPVVRWDESTPGCTFSHTDDGKYLYGMWSDDVGVTLSVDSQELEKVQRRHEPFFSVLVEIHYRGNDGLDVPIQGMSLKFSKHFNVVQPALDPDQFTERIQTDADNVDHEAAREVERHPEQKESKEAYVRAFQKDAAELIEFVSKNSLRPAHLDPGNPKASGWILFSTQSRWISGWKKQEEFLLRLPLGGKILEFPFKLPPKEGELLLRKRE